MTCAMCATVDAQLSSLLAFCAVGFGAVIVNRIRHEILAARRGRAFINGAQVARLPAALHRVSVPDYAQDGDDDL
jgi:hypothetical protein